MILVCDLSTREDSRSHECGTLIGDSGFFVGQLGLYIINQYKNI